MVIAGVDVFVNDPTIMAACATADITVIQMTGAHNLSNRFYKVHSRRNDRFLSGSPLMAALYPDMDFSEYNFTRHLLSALFETAQGLKRPLAALYHHAYVERRYVFTGPNGIGSPQTIHVITVKGLQALEHIAGNGEPRP